MIKLVVVDDHPLVGETISYILKKKRRNVEYIGQALTGSKGLELAKEHNPDIALVDLKMPGMNGFALTKQLKKILPLTKVAIITAFDDSEYIQRALELGVSDYVFKPLSCEEVLALIDKLCSELNCTASSPSKTYSSFISSILPELTNYIQIGETQNVCNLLNEIWPELIVLSDNDVVLVRIRAVEIATAILLFSKEITCFSDTMSLSYQSFINKIAVNQSMGSIEICLKEFVESISNMFDRYMHETWYQQISRAKELIELNLHTNITLESISSTVYLSPCYLSHLFKEKTGTNFMDYVIERRIEKAKLLLTTTNEKIESIALETGYDNANSFRRLFKKRTGVSPSQYRFAATNQY